MSEEYNSERDMERFWAEITPRSEPVSRRWFLPVIGLALVASVPWYWPSGSHTATLAGLPVWVWITIGCSAVISSTTAWVTLRHWRDDEGDGP